MLKRLSDSRLRNFAPELTSCRKTDGFETLCGYRWVWQVDSLLRWLGLLKDTRQIRMMRANAGTSLSSGCGWRLELRLYVPPETSAAMAP